MLKVRFFFLFFLLSTFLFAQKKTINGYVSDDANGEKLIGVSVYDTKSKFGTTTNIYGFYSLTLSSDSADLIFSYVGYSPVKKSIGLTGNINLNIHLKTNTQLQTVEIVAEEKISQKTQMSTIDIPVEQIKKIPALLGETDVLKVLQLLPGVKSGGEGSSGIYVRGGSPDQNLILLDGTPVYNASHLFGFFSVFNADAIKNVQLIKGGFPAHYGGRLSSVIDISMKEGSMKKYNIEGSVGIISSRLLVEGPLWKDKTSFIITARRTYIDILARPLIKKMAEGNGIAGYYFYDMNAKINHRFSDKDHLYLSVYNGLDKFYAKTSSTYNDFDAKYTDSQKYSLAWGNVTSALRWNHVLNSKLFSNTHLTYSQYHFDVGANMEDKAEYSNGTKEEQSFNLKYLSGINDWSLKNDFDYLPNPNHYIKFGAAGIYHTFNTGTTQYKLSGTSTTALDTSFGGSKLYATELSTYIEDDWKITDLLKVNIGLHASGFFVKDKFYKSLQPRIAARYLVTEEWSVKASYCRMAQYIHLLSNSNIGLPTDLWVPATDKVKPQQATQYALGVAKDLYNKGYELSVEGYYKKMNNIIDYLDGANFVGSNTDWQKKVSSGTGWSYGAEVFLQKKKGKMTGWVSYTLSWTNRQFDLINSGEKYPFKYDNRHSFAIVWSYKLSEAWDLAVTWEYKTGNAISLPLQTYNAASEPSTNMGGYGGYNYYGTIDYYGSKNNFRMPSYHRLDLGANYHKKKKWGEAVWNFGVYNAYNRHNPYFIYFDHDMNGRKVAKQFSLFPILPSISYSFKISPTKNVIQE